MGNLPQALCLLIPPAVLCILLLAASTVPFVNATPIQVPDLGRCGNASDTQLSSPYATFYFNCCLPIPSGAVKTFSLEASPQTHYRQAAHNVSAEYIAKYARAYELMRALPEDDPRSLAVQANIHCAFCNGAYRQTGNESLTLQVHFSWLFLPWHRWYLYFHERILASLLGEPDFSLVFWNWDDQEDGGNVIPAMFLDNATSLYDALRDQDHLPPTIVRISSGTTSNDSERIQANLNAMYKGIVSASTAELFLGGAFSTGTDLSNSSVTNAPLGGSIENGVHNTVHYWTGDPTQPLRQNMGTFIAASKDPLFYAHHSNVDRLWDVWHSGLPSGTRPDHTETDFLDAEFYFYDETASLVKVKVSDVLDSSKLGISYAPGFSDDAWINYSSSAVTTGSAVAEARMYGASDIGEYPQGGPIPLGSRLVGIVKRPAGEKPSGKVEVLVIQGLKVRRDKYVSVIAFVNMPGATERTMTHTAEYVGTFNIMPSPKHKRLMTNVKWEIGDNLQRIGLQNEPEVVITLAVDGNQPITIEGMRIEYE